MKAETVPNHSIKREYEDDEEYTALLESTRQNKIARRLEDGEVIELLED